MKTIIHTLSFFVAASMVAAAGEPLKALTEKDAKISQMDLIIMKRSVALLGANHKLKAPKFNLMFYDDAENKLIQYFTVEATELDRVLAGDKTHLDLYKFRYDSEYSTLRNYLGVWKEDYSFEMRFGLVGGGKGVFVDKNGVHDRDTNKKLNSGDAK